jgi:hypothetical protein
MLFEHHTRIALVGLTVRSRTRDFAQPLSCKLFSSFYVQTALKLLPTARLSRGTWGFKNIGTESPVKPSSATIAALYELFLVDNRITQWPQFAPRYGFGHRE